MSATAVLSSTTRNSLPPSPNWPYRGGLKGKWLAVFMEYAWPVGHRIIRLLQGSGIHNIHYYTFNNYYANM